MVPSNSTRLSSRKTGENAWVTRILSCIRLLPFLFSSIPQRREKNKGVSFPTKKRQEEASSLPFPISFFPLRRKARGQRGPFFSKWARCSRSTRLTYWEKERSFSSASRFFPDNLLVQRNTDFLFQRFHSITQKNYTIESLYRLILRLKKHKVAESSISWRNFNCADAGRRISLFSGTGNLFGAGKTGEICAHPRSTD